MAPERRQRVLLGVLGVVVLLAALYWLWPAPATQPRPASNPRSARRAGGAQGAATETAPDVHLQALEAERPKPGEVDRDLFRFKPKAPPPAPVSPRPAVPPPQASSGPPGPPPLPPITLKFFGVIQEQGTGRKLAALSDGRSVWHGGEGDVVLGQYKILHIGTESIEMAYLDGRGRQTIRLSGS